MSTRFFTLVAAVAAIIWFAQLGYRDLIEPDEGRYAEIPREMVATGDWVTPRLNGFKYFEKPVLQYWATATAYTLFGDNATTARLWPALTGFLGALWAGFLALHLYGRSAGFYAFLITLSGLLYIIDGHYLLLDMSLAVFLVMGVGCLVLAQCARRDPSILRNWMLAGWVALALATLSKGLIGVVLPAATVVVYSLWARDWLLWRKLHLLKGLAVFLLVSAPWFVAVSLANPEFPQFFFIHEHLQRYTSTVHRREGGYWYFLPVFLLGIFPWVAVALKSLLRPGFSSRLPGEAAFDAERFLWSFALVVFVFFSAGQSKLPSYILPMMPVVAVMAGRRLATEGYHRVDGWLLAIMAVALLLTGWQIAALESDVIPLTCISTTAPGSSPLRACMASRQCWPISSAACAPLTLPSSACWHCWLHRSCCSGSSRWLFRAPAMSWPGSSVPMYRKAPRSLPWPATRSRWRFT